MLVLEYAVLAIGLFGVFKLVARADGFVRRTGRTGQADVPLPHLAARLQPADGALKVGVVGDTGPGDRGTRFVIAGVSPGLAVVRAQGAGRLPEPAPSTGDPMIDGSFVVGGDPALVHALLDVDTRRLLQRAAGTMEPGAAVVERGTLTVTVGLSHRLDAKAVLRRGREAVALGRRLLQPDDVPRRLSENAHHDPLAGVRLCAALAMGTEGNDVLLALAGDAAAGLATATAAIGALGKAAPFDVVVEVLRRAVGPRPVDGPADVQATGACLAALATLGGAGAISRLEDVLLTVPPAADDAARALARIGGAAAEEALIAGLASDRSECRLAVVPVLAEMGTVAAVAPLMDAQRHGGDLRSRARWAITRIQSRLTGEAGAVSLADGEGGQLTLAPDAAGEVSLGPDRAKG